MRVYVVTLEPEGTFIGVFSNLISTEKMLNEGGELHLIRSYPSYHYEATYAVNGIKYAVTSKDI